MMAHIGTVEHSPDGLIIWRADVGVALGPVTFDAYGIGIGVDAADPAAVVAVVAGAGDGDSGASCFADPGFLAELVGARQGAILKGPTLVEDVARAATIHAVDKYFVGLLDEGIVALDEANALALSGDNVRAHGRYLMSATTLEVLLDDLAVTASSPSVLDELEDMVAHCPAMDPDRRVTAVAAAIAEHDDAAWPQVVVTDEIDWDLAGRYQPEATNPGDLLDLSLLPPRMIRFTGPDQLDLSLRVLDDETVEASAVLRDEILGESSDVDGMFVVAMDSGTGELVSSAPCSVDGLILAARLWLADKNIDDLHFALVARTVPLSSVRGDPFSVRVSRLDRQCRHVWTQYRRATALVAMVTGTSDGAAIDSVHQTVRFLQADAEQLAENTESALVRLWEGTADPVAEQILAKYLDGVRRLRRLVSAPGALDGPVRPTLAELCAAAGR